MTQNNSAGSVRISDLLLHGRENAQTQRDLATLTGLTPRIVRVMIERERRQGAQILSDNRSGYYLARSADEALRWCAWMDSRADEIRATVAGVREGAVP